MKPTAPSMASPGALWGLQSISTWFQTFLAGQQDVRGRKYTQSQCQLCKTLFLSLWAVHTQISKQQLDSLLSLSTNPTNMAAVDPSMLGTLHWQPQKCTNYVLQNNRNTVKAVPLRVAFIPHRTGTTKTRKKPRSCQAAAPKTEVSKEATQPLSNSHPQAQLVTAEPSSLFSVKPTSKCLFLKQGWGWGAHTHIQSTTKISRGRTKRPLFNKEWRLLQPNKWRGLSVRGFSSWEMQGSDGIIWKRPVRSQTW